MGRPQVEVPILLAHPDDPGAQFYRSPDGGMSFWWKLAPNSDPRWRKVKVEEVD